MGAAPHHEPERATRSAARPSRVRSRAITLLVIAVVIVAVVAYFAFGMPGMDHSPDPMDMENMQPVDSGRTAR